MNNFFFTCIKLILAALLLPVTLACCFSFYKYLTLYQANYQYFFLWGVVAFLLIFIFIYQCWGVYEFAQNVMAGILKFTSPINDILAYFIPLYPTAILLTFWVTISVMKLNNGAPVYFMFFTGFTLAMHIFMTAQDLQDKEKTIVKSSYLFMMNLIFVSNIFIAVMLMDLVMQKWTFPDFFRGMSEMVNQFYAFSFDKFYKS